MRKRKFNVEENLFDHVERSDRMDYPCIEGGHLWDFREIDDSACLQIRSQGTQWPFPTPSCEREFQRYLQVHELRNLFHLEVSKLGIEPPKECINRWLFEQLAVPRAEDEITIFDNGVATNAPPQGNIKVSNSEPLLRCPKEASVLRTQLLEALPGSISLPYKQKKDINAVRDVYSVYVDKALQWIIKWIQEGDESKEINTMKHLLTDISNRIHNGLEISELESAKDEAESLCDSTLFTSRFGPVIEPIIIKVIQRAEELSQNINNVQSNIKEEKVTIRERENNEKSLEYKGNVVNISGLHYLKLAELYKINSRRTGVSKEDSDYQQSFHRALYVLARRYATFFGDNEGEGFHAAAPEAAFEVMNNSLGVVQELFASPFNCHFGKFCSAFPDIDCWFGSCGSFFDFLPVSGSFEVGPPYVASVMDQTATRLEELLQNSTEPLSFIVFVPEWKDPIAEYHKIMESSQFLQLEFVMGGNDHAYVVGDQHKSDTRYVKLPFRTSVYILQNAQGATKWPVTKTLQKELEESLRGPIELKKQKSTGGRKKQEDHIGKKTPKKRKGAYKRYQCPPSKRGRKQ